MTRNQSNDIIKRFLLVSMLTILIITALGVNICTAGNNDIHIEMKSIDQDIKYVSLDIESLLREENKKILEAFRKSNQKSGDNLHRQKYLEFWYDEIV